MDLAATGGEGMQEVGMQACAVWSAVGISALAHVIRPLVANMVS